MKIKTAGCFVVFFFLFSSLLSQNDTIELGGIIGEKRSGLFDSDELLELTLRFDLTQFNRTKQLNDYQEAVMTYYLNGKDTVSRTVRIRARGKFRRDFCDFPPIRLNLKKGETPEDEFSNIDKIKLVTHCKAGNSEYVIREYLTYKIFALFTDISFRVRLLRINYINTRRPGKPVTEYAFLIEPVELLTERTNTIEVKSEKLSQRQIRPEYIDRLAIFNYMIGNYDWAVPGQQNLVVLLQPGVDSEQFGIVAPYDFDYSGLVNAPYALPPETLPIKSVRQRMFRGICRDEESYRKALNEFLEKQNAIYEVIDKCPYLKDGSKKDMKNYLGTFFRDFDKRNTIVNKLLNECQKL
ncbi:MAG: hypothetical protein HPY62_01750 [Bacteroidales bacterium]|nr:hypothetical protein [Bacteroidales bacterium]